MLVKLIRTVFIAAAITVVGAAQAASVKIGFVTTLTTPAGVIGEDMKNSVNLALEHIGNKMGDLDVV
ncbi:MAG: ABC transporter substrate-binding protein, partial [Gammaproteobacteria bacterium]|nr:ABC transporter substrate-binding protein [Gammaproteobacteria bacterium]